MATRGQKSLPLRVRVPYQFLSGASAPVDTRYEYLIRYALRTLLSNPFSTGIVYSTVPKVLYPTVQYVIAWESYPPAKDYSYRTVRVPAHFCYSKKVVLVRVRSEVLRKQASTFLIFYSSIRMRDVSGILSDLGKSKRQGSFLYLLSWKCAGTRTVLRFSEATPAERPLEQSLLQAGCQSLCTRTSTSAAFPHRPCSAIFPQHRHCFAGKVSSARENLLRTA